ncbi:MAG: Long-chain-fatty-acid--CoA ligase FadD15 [Calditrichaeota bacterium]|nr:Long-chain-fatty-acid--CoA ligase FadD15 [Calditrichota bacterium]
MPDTIDTVERSLDAWVAGDGGGSGRTDDAVRLLEMSRSLLADGADAEGARELLHRFLETTARPEYLASLPDDRARHRWADAAIEAIGRSGYTLETMLDARVAEIPHKPLFRELQSGDGAGWSYAHVRRRARAFAAVFLREAGESPPRVALLADNSVDGACCDLACLLHDILVTPLNVHFDIDELAWIFDRLAIDTAVIDREDRLEKLLALRKRVRRPFRIFAINMESARAGEGVRLLAESITHLSEQRIDETVANRPRFGLHDVCTVMFTSGSTGRPKGVAFTMFNLVTKRFARAAALPAVGRDEVLLCYLPLFHTFGRYLEMLGMLFWRGTYVFVGNPSAESLLAGLKRVEPTGLISIPLRWSQIRDRCLERMEPLRTRDERVRALRGIVGNNLRWGLSAAGYLEPKAFRFFQHYGIELCSGFGMTEATGGITMSPPGDYIDNTVGKPLPGVFVRLTSAGEMQISGPYIACYLSPGGRDLETEPGISDGGREWLPTGDIFKRLKRDQLAIVDRIKDIYKNNRGQTIAPRRVEQKFATVPGVKRTFLVGDHRSYNVLLIVPNPADPVLASAPDDESRNDYFRQIVTAANQDLVPPDRVVNFTLLDRDFSIDRGELTPKGSLRRKVIEKHFARTIAGLYESSHVTLEAGGFTVRIPRWVFRDLGILESDVSVVGEHPARDAHAGIVLADTVHDRSLPLRRDGRRGFTVIGDLAYRLAGDVIDLGVFARQPRLWITNPALIEFAPCREGWDLPFDGQVDAHAMLPAEPARREPFHPVNPAQLSDSELRELNHRLQAALYGPVDGALAALEQLSGELISYDDRLGGVARLRIAALATHPHERLRCAAYRILLLDEPMPDYSVSFPAFVQSGLSFLNEQSIKHISRAGFEHRRLAALRQRLYSYRVQLAWPAEPVVRRQFKNVFRLLVNFVRFNPEYYKPVRAELASWILHRDDPQLSRFAEMMLDHLVSWFEGRLVEHAPSIPERLLEAMLVFDEDLDEGTRDNLRDLLLYTTFLKQSVMLAFEEEEFDLDHVPEGGIWVSRIKERGAFSFYRISVNTIAGKHFDLLVVQREDMNARAVMDTNHWMMAIGSHPYGHRVLPRFGCVRPELAALSVEYVRELTAQEKIRRFAGHAHPQAPPAKPAEWRRLLITAIATFFRAWNYSGRRIIPGVLAPDNVVVPELDFREEALILSLNGWEPYDGPSSLMRPLFENFFAQTRADNPRSARVIDEDWLFDACVEGLGRELADTFLREFAGEIRDDETEPFAGEFAAGLGRYIDGLGRRWYVPLPVHNAINRYHAWERINPNVTSEARAELLEGLVTIYNLDRYGEIARYHLYRHTYFANAGEAVTDAFSELLDGLWRSPEIHATQRVELSELQAALDSQEDRDVFSRLVFPRAHRPQDVEVITFGESGRRQVVVKTHIADSHDVRYDIREPVEPEEVGSLYRLFYQERFPKSVSGQDHHLIVTDPTGRVVAGLTYKVQEQDVVHMDGLVTSGPLMGRGIATGLLEDFVTRMASHGVKLLKTDFMMRDFCAKRGFHTDRNWGGLVRYLAREQPETAEVDIPAR